MGIACSCFATDYTAGSVELKNNVTVVPQCQSPLPSQPADSTSDQLKSLLRGYLTRKSIQKSLNPSNAYEISTLPVSSFQSQNITKTEESLQPYSLEISGPVFLMGQEYYQGSFNRRFMKHGAGILILEDNRKYIGQFKLDKMQGEGRMIFENGDVYEGEFMNNHAHGYGKYVHVDKSSYTGEFKKDKQHGYGHEVWNNGSKYEGMYRKGLKHGRGVLDFSEDISYTGDFCENRIEGKGVYRWSQEKWYEGDMVDNKMQGSGVLHSQSGIVYEGEFHDDQKNGFGVCNWPDGRVFEGMWQDGVQHGEGSFTSVRLGKIEKRKGVWNRGRREKWIEE